MIDARLIGAEAGASLTIAVAFLVAWLIAELLARTLLPRLAHSGILPETLRAVRAASRVCTPPLALLAIGDLLPRDMRLAAPLAAGVLLLATAFAARGVMLDIAAGAIAAAEGRVRTGARLTFDGQQGVVTARGLRVTEVALDDGTLLELPNRRLLRGRIDVDPDKWAPVEVTVAVPPSSRSVAIRSLLEELALVSPYLAPARPPRVNRDPDRPDVWRVEARLVHPRYAIAFRSALVEQFEELTSGGGRPAAAGPRILSVVPRPPSDDGTQR